MGTFADYTAIFAVRANSTTSSTNLQGHLLTIQNWLQKWKIKVNETLPSGELEGITLKNSGKEHKPKLFQNYLHIK